MVLKDRKYGSQYSWPVEKKTRKRRAVLDRADLAISQGLGKYLMSKGMQGAIHPSVAGREPTS